MANSRKPALFGGSKWNASPEEAQAAYEKKQREDEDAVIASQRRQESLFPVTGLAAKSWSYMNQAQRNAHIEAFEQRVYEVFGQFPKANWMH